MVGKILLKLLLPLAVTLLLFIVLELSFAFAISAISSGSVIAVARVHRHLLCPSEKGTMRRFFRFLGRREGSGRWFVQHGLGI